MTDLVLNPDAYWGYGAPVGCILVSPTTFIWFGWLAKKPSPHVKARFVIKDSDLSLRGAA